MIDLTNYDHKRGLMVLTSKDIRTIDRTLFNYVVDIRDIEHYIECMRSLTIKYHDKIDDTYRADIETYIKYTQKCLNVMTKNIEECRRVFM